MPSSNNNEYIYIDCNPVDIRGEEINEDTNEFVQAQINNELLNEMETWVVGGGMFEDVVFQSFAGVFMITIIYTIGSYVFKDIPKSIIDKRVESGY